MARNGSSPPHQHRRVRVRSRPLEQIDEAKLAVALSIMARRLIEQRAQPRGVGRCSADQPEIA